MKTRHSAIFWLAGALGLTACGRDADRKTEQDPGPIVTAKECVHREIPDEASLSRDSWVTVRSGVRVAKVCKISEEQMLNLVEEMNNEK